MGYLFLWWKFIWLNFTSLHKFWDLDRISKIICHLQILLKMIIILLLSSNVLILNSIILLLSSIVLFNLVSCVWILSINIIKQLFFMNRYILNYSIRFVCLIGLKFLKRSKFLKEYFLSDGFIILKHSFDFLFTPRIPIRSMRKNIDQILNSKKS